jgi:NodT family efflux transporter outer membrane factor (OMF) lipoprotein
MRTAGVSRSLRRYGPVAAALFAAGCAVGPNYKRPDAPVPAAYKATPAADAEQAHPDWKEARPSDTADRGAWWEVFGDPQLDALEARVSVSNQNVALAEAQFRGARAVARGAKAEFFPTIGATPSVTRSHSPLARTSALPGAPAGTATTYQLSGDVSWEIDLWGRIRRNVESKVEAAAASAADLETVRLSLHAELAIDYFTLRGTDEQRRLLRSNVEAYDRALRLTVQKHDQGVVSGVDVAQAQTQLESTRAQLTDLDLSRSQLENAIAILVGQPPSTISIDESEKAIAPVAPPPELPSALLERRPDIAAAERRVASANAGIGVAQAAFFPALLMNATGGWESSSWTRWISAPNLFWSLGVALAQTIFDGGARIAGKEQAVAAYDATVASYRENVLEAFQDVEDNLTALRLLSTETDQQARAVDAAERALALAESRYRGGITSYLEVVTAQTTALANERTAVDLQTRRLLASVNLIKALGGGWDASQLPAPRAILAGPVRAEEPAASSDGGAPPKSD